jgi:dGTPase
LATGLGHDLGNPPFGHQGEAAIGRWFKHRQAWIFSKRVCGVLDLSVSDIVPDALRAEFTAFDGNPQALRLLTRLQTHVDGMGLDLSAATLAAGLKYPVSFAGADEKSPVKKKGGYFSSERSVVDWIRNQTGLDEGQRHPLTWIMEACDDIAYSVLDVDDVLKKAVMSPDDVLVVLRRKIPGNPTVNGLHDLFIRIEDKEIRPDALRDIKIQYLRAHFIGALISHASDQFTDNITAIFSHRHEMPLMDNSPLCTALKEIAKKYAFENPDVLRAEALGAAALDGLMSAFWEACLSELEQKAGNHRTERQARLRLPIPTSRTTSIACLPAPRRKAKQPLRPESSPSRPTWTASPTARARRSGHGPIAMHCSGQAAPWPGAPRRIGQQRLPSSHWPAI